MMRTAEGSYAAVLIRQASRFKKNFWCCLHTYFQYKMVFRMTCTISIRTVWKRSAKKQSHARSIQIFVGGEADKIVRIICPNHWKKVKRKCPKTCTTPKKELVAEYIFCHCADDRSPETEMNEAKKSLLAIPEADRFA